MALDFTESTLDALARWLISAEHLLPHYVHQWCYGHYAGSYEEPNLAAALSRRDEHQAKFGGIGFRYEVRQCDCVPGFCRCGEGSS